MHGWIRERWVASREMGAGWLIREMGGSLGRWVAKLVVRLPATAVSGFESSRHLSNNY
jgi:hypothetical protein